MKMKTYLSFGKDEPGIRIIKAGDSDNVWFGLSITSEVEDSDGDRGTLSFYAVPQSDNSGLVFLFLGEGDGLSEFIQSLDAESVELYQKKWPRLMLALNNGGNHYYHNPDEPAFLCPQDIPNGRKNCWGLVTQVENVEILESILSLAKVMHGTTDDNDVANLKSIKYLTEKASRIAKFANEMMLEVQNNDIGFVDNMGAFMKSILKGVIKGIRIGRTMDRTINGLNSVIDKYREG